MTLEKSLLGFNQRALDLFQLRDSGLAWKQIGSQVGLSSSYAARLYKRNKRLLEQRLSYDDTWDFEPRKYAGKWRFVTTPAHPKITEESP